MWRILQQENAEDFVIATGEAHSLELFVSTVFAALGLDWRDHVEIDTALFRPSEIQLNKGNPAKARIKLGWIASSKMHEVAQKMVAAEVDAANI
jgi:GDPmannose 4,6-dehydratase